MPDFFVRIEMHGATEPQYEILHQRMRVAGYFMSIQAPGAANSVRLPTAMYHVGLDDTVTAAAMRAQVMQIASGVRPQPPPWVLVMKTADWAIQSKANP